MEYHCLIFGFGSTAKWMVVLSKCPAELHGKTELRPPSSSWSAWAFVSLKSIWFWMLLCLPKRWRTFQGNEQMILWTLINHINIRNGWMKMEKETKIQKKKKNIHKVIDCLDSLRSPLHKLYRLNSVVSVGVFMSIYLAILFCILYCILLYVKVSLSLLSRNGIHCINGRKEAIS